MQDLLRAIRRVASGLWAGLDFVPPLFARLVIGVVFVGSGWGKLHDLEHVTAFFTELGIPFPAIQAPFVSGIELACGALVLVGLATRMAAVPLIGTMVVALLTALWDQIEGLRGLFGTVELVYIALLVGLVIRGAGPLSLDALVARRLDAPSADRHGPDNVPTAATVTSTNGSTRSTKLLGSRTPHST